MKVMALAKVKDDLSACVDAAQGDRILITRHGRPAAILVGVEGEAIEDLLTASDQRFWREIETRRKQTKTLSGEELGAQLATRRGRRKT